MESSATHPDPQQSHFLRNRPPGTVNCAGISTAGKSQTEGATLQVSSPFEPITTVGLSGGFAEVQIAAVFLRPSPGGDSRAREGGGSEEVSKLHLGLVGTF
jgi:hypothetical protein